MESASGQKCPTTTGGMTRPSTWADIRSSGFISAASGVIADLAPVGIQVLSVQHLRSSHYGVYRVKVRDGGDHVVRIGLEGPAATPVDNSGFAGTATSSPTGQLREKTMAEGFAAAGASVIVPSGYVRWDGLESLWMPHLVGSDTPITARQWHQALTALYQYQPQDELPVFTNRVKTFARLEDLPGGMADSLRNQYDTALEELFDTATQWSVVHGDAHAGNALNLGGVAVLYDFDTACWAPSVWDLTHLLNRVGTKNNTGYTGSELTGLFQFSAEEVDAALRLRKVASEVARVHRDYNARARSCII